MTSNIMIRNSRIARAVGVLFTIRSVPSIQTVSTHSARLQSHIGTYTNISHHNRQLYRYYSSGGQRKPILTLYTKDDCTLCDDSMKELSHFLDQASGLNF